jgi:exodeoxyribonuclease VII small subunit
MTFESSARRLEEIVDQLEDGSLELDAALRLFEEGVATLRQVSDELARADAKLQELVERSDGTFALRDRDV